ncbi:MAG: O-antigen ligase family protein [Candidatus Aureabacteria bacterium]|nr:O-antigen ligase family protein [Candidatus Auribacterota bacterium]
MLDKIYKALIFCGLTFILIWSPLAFGAAPKRVWSITPVLFVIALLVFLWLWKLNNGRKTPDTKLHITALDILIFLFVSLAVISFIFSVYKHDSFYALLRLLSYVGLYYLILNNYSRKFRRYLIGLVISIGTGISVFGLLQHFGFLSHWWWNPENFLAATYVNHNHFSGYLELVIPVTIGAIILYKSSGIVVKTALIGALFIMISAFIFAQSRGAWISLSIALFLMNVLLIRVNILKMRSLLIMFLIVTAIFSLTYLREGSISRRIDSISDVASGEATLETRLQIWNGTIEMIQSNPLTGTGIGTFVWGFSRYRPVGLNARAHYAHNDYLHMAAEMGIFALPLMIFMLVIIISRGLTKGVFHPVVLGCAVGMLSLSLHGLVDFNFHIPANMLLYIVYAAIIMKETET